MNNEADITLSRALHWLRYHEIRAIVTALGLGRRATQNQKAAWVAAIAAAWLDPAQQPHLLARLSAAAHGALWRLLQAGELPRLLFLGEYGGLRLPGDQDQDTAPMAGGAAPTAAPPWRQPQTVSEALFYAGLLFPAAQHAIDDTPTFHLPADLQRALAHPLATRLGIIAEPRLPLTPLPAAPPPLLHDLAQWLIYLHQQRDLVLQQGRWLSPRRLHAFTARLLQPPPQPPLPTHKNAPWPALLSFLAVAAELVQVNQVTAAGWQWLAADPAQQLRLLWDGWWRADQALRLAYHQPAAQLPAPWPRLVLPHLTETFAPAGLTHRLLAQESGWHGYFIAHLSDLHQLDKAHADLLAVLWHVFGAIVPAYALEEEEPLAPAGAKPLTATAAFTNALPHDGAQDRYDQAPSAHPAYHHPAYQVTALGRWLLDRPRARDPLSQWQRRRVAAPALVATPAQLIVTIPAAAPPLPLAQLAPFALVETDADPGRAVVATGLHTYFLNATTVGQAAATHAALPTLLAALTSVGLTLTPDLIALLQTWHSAGRQLHLTLLPIIRTADAALMARLQQNRRLQPWLGEVLNPTTAVWHGVADALVAALRDQGFYPEETAWAQAAAPGVEENAPAASLPGDRGALWLAARTYQLLGRFLPLPLPLPAEQVRTLEQGLSPLQQAALQAQLAQVEARLLQVLDHLPFTPPPTPADPTQWRSLLDAAITAKQTLQMIYVSAGRNLTTQRLIDPYWIEEQHGVPYLRAYCHSAGAVLTFRLDRIEALQPAP